MAIQGAKRQTNTPSAPQQGVAMAFFVWKDEPRLERYSLDEMKELIKGARVYQERKHGRLNIYIPLEKGVKL